MGYIAAAAVHRTAKCCLQNQQQQADGKRSAVVDDYSCSKPQLWQQQFDNGGSGLVHSACRSSSIDSKMLLQYFCNNIILMKQILILYFCYFEPMSLWYTNFTRNSGTVEVQRQLRPLFLILTRSARQQNRTRYCTQYSTAG